MVKQATIEHIDRTLADPAGQWLLKAHPHGQIEWPNDSEQRLAQTTGEDRVFFAEDCWWIVDFKTAEPNLAKRDDFLEHEVGRYRCQLVNIRRPSSVKDQPNRFETPQPQSAVKNGALFHCAGPSRNVAIPSPGLIAFRVRVFTMLLPCC